MNIEAAFNCLIHMIGKSAAGVELCAVGKPAGVGYRYA